MKKFIVLFTLSVVLLGFNGYFNSKEDVKLIENTESNVQTLSSGVATISDSTLEYTVLNKESKTCSVSSYDNVTFEGEVIIPSTVDIDGITYTVVKISEYTFRNCKITHVTIPVTVETIDKSAFSGCSELEEVKFDTKDGKSNLTTIGDSAFSECTNLTTVDLSKTGITIIQGDLFSNCTSLKTVILPNVIEVINSYSFANCEKLSNINLNNMNLTTIGASAFSGCTSLVELNVDNTNLTTIGTSAFSGCTSLVELNVDNTNLTTIGASAFSGCTSLDELNVDNTNLKTIENNAFLGTALITVEINNANLKTIGNNAFNGCTKLTTLDISNTSVETIGTSAFSGCTSLSNVNLPDTLKTIGASAFLNNSIVVLTIPSSVTSIEDDAFNKSATVSTLKVINLNADLSSNSVSISPNAFSSIIDVETTSKHSICQIIVSEENYKYINVFTSEEPNYERHFTYEIKLEVDFNGGKLNGETPSEVEIIRLYNRNFNYILNEKKVWETIEDFNIYSILPSGSESEEFNKIIKSDREQEDYVYHFAKYLLNGVELTATSTILNNNSIVASFESYFIVAFTANTYRIEGISSLWNKEDSLIIPSYYNDGVNGEHKITQIGEYAFQGLNFETVVFGEYVERIRSYAFNGTTITGEVVFLYDYISINSYAFNSTTFTYTEPLKLPDKLETINSNVFFNARFEYGIEFSSLLSKISESAFENATFTAVVEIPSTVTTIDSNAFKNAKLTYVYLNDTAKYGDDIFIDAKADNIIAVDKVSYESILDNINNNILTYMIEVTLDYDGGLANGKYTLVLQRLKGYGLDYEMNYNTKIWAENTSFTLTEPYKYGFVFVSWDDGTYSNDTEVVSLNASNSNVTLSSIYTEDTIIKALYNKVELESLVGEDYIESLISSNEGFDISSQFYIKVADNNELATSLINDGVDVYNVYTISLTLDGANYTPTGNLFTIQILLPDDMNKITDYTIYKVVDGSYVEIEATYSRGYITFTTDTLGDFILQNEPIPTGIVTPGSTAVKTSLLNAILIMAIVNILELIFIFTLNRKKQKNIVAYSSILPLLILSSFMSQENIAYSILIALTVTAILQAIYIIYLFLTRNASLFVNQQVETVVTETILPPTESVVTMENLEDLLEKSKEIQEKFAEEDLMLEEYVEEDIEVFIDEEPIREMMNLDNLDDDSGEDDIDDNDDEVDEEEEVRTRMSSTGQLIVIKFKKSFTARLNLTDDINKDFHTALKNKLLSYKKINSRVSWHHEAYNFGRNQAAKMNVRGRTLFLYLPLDPADYEESKYPFKDCGHIKKFEQLPFRVKIKSKRGLKYAFELIETVMQNFETIEKKKFEPINYYERNRGFERLLKEGLIKEVISSETYSEVVETTEIIKTTKSTNDELNTDENKDGVLDSIEENIDENPVLKPNTNDDVALDVKDDILSSLENTEKEIVDAIVIEDDIDDFIIRDFEDLQVEYVLDLSEINATNEKEEIKEEPKRTVVETTQTITTVISTPTQTVSSTQTITPTSVTTEIKPIQNVSNTALNDEEDDDDDDDDIISFKPSQNFQATQSVVETTTEKEEVEIKPIQKIVIEPFRPVHVDSNEIEEEMGNKSSNEKESIDDIYSEFKLK